MTGADRSELRNNTRPAHSSGVGMWTRGRSPPWDAIHSSKHGRAVARLVPGKPITALAIVQLWDSGLLACVVVTTGLLPLAANARRLAEAVDAVHDDLGL